MKASNKLILGLALAGIGGAAGYWWHAADQRRARIAAALPPAPPLASAPAELRARHAQAREKAVHLSVPLAALGELSRLYHANGFLREATACYRALEELDPREPRWPHRHATVLAGFGDAPPAIALWERVLQLAPHYTAARLRVAELKLKTNQPTAAASEFNQVLQREPDQPHALLGLARIDFDAGRWPEARTRLERVVAQTNYALGYDLIVSVYEKLGETARAADVRRRAKASGAYRDPADPWMEELLADCFDAYRLSLAAGEATRAGDAPKAQQLLERAVALAPDDAPVRYQLATLLIERRDAAGAQKHLERCTKTLPTLTDAWAQWAALRLQANDVAGAAALITAGLQHSPDSPGLHLMRARVHRQTGQIPAAVEAYRRSLQLRPNEAEPYVELATLLLQHNQPTEALQHLHRAVLVEPDHPSALALLALTAISQGDEPTARKWLARVQAQPRIAAAQAQRLHAAYRGQFGRDFAP